RCSGGGLRRWSAVRVVIGRYGRGCRSKGSAEKKSVRVVHSFLNSSKPIKVLRQSSIPLPAGTRIQPSRHCFSTVPAKVFWSQFIGSGEPDLQPTRPWSHHTCGYSCCRELR